MTLELSSLFIAGFLYLVLLFLIAYVTDRGLIPERWVSHPLVYTLSLGVYATSWTYYGSVGLANSNGYLFLTIYLGVTLAFALSPVLLRPILRLTAEYQLSSLADLFAFRYRSQVVGVLVTLFMLIGALPYIALQIRAVTQSLHELTQEAPPHILALGFCITLTAFAILFGARHISPRQKHRGLVMAIAFESLIKLLALLGVGLFALFGVFSGPDSLNQWLSEHPEAIQKLYEPVGSTQWSTLIFLAFGAAFLLPRQFHMLFAENLKEDNLRFASWGFPLFLLLLNLPIPVILWAGHYLGLSSDPDYFVLSITLSQGHSWLPLLTFIGGISAASAMVIITTLALSSMCMNHLLLPASYPDPRVNLYYWLLWGRRLMIGLIILAGYSFYAFLEHRAGLAQLGLISFVAVAQFLPGIIGLLYWRRATREGVIAGLLAGITVWGFTLLVPMLKHSGFIENAYPITQWQAMLGLDHWSFATFWSLSLNGLLFAMISLASRQRSEEQQAAASCCSSIFIPLTGVVAARSPEEFKQELGVLLGRSTAEKEVNHALSDLDMSPAETRPAELRRLRERIERNLYGLIGPQMSHLIVNQKLALDPEARTALADSMRYVEERLAHSRSLLHGLTRELDNLQRYQRQILEDLPLGACALGQDGEIIIWNQAMEDTTGIEAKTTIGHPLSQLPEPWNDLLGGFARAADSHSYHLEVHFSGRTRWFNLHKAAIEDPQVSATSEAPGMVILIEDLTQMENLEAELAHSDRLASIGRLAAGVAHEIGNPVTGIASIAQNLKYEEEPGAIEQSTRDILTQTRRITDIVQSLMNFSRSSTADRPRENVAVREVLEDALALIQLMHKHDGLNYHIDCDEQIMLHADRQRLSQVFVNLLNNASDASTAGSSIQVLAHQDDQQLTIEVIDEGSGIPDHFREQLFEPFATTKRTGKGTGLGLALARNIILDHNGNIEIDSEPGRGTRVIISFPRQQ
ncbi:sensor histidine kinase [Thiolapillus brandeum]|uniref:histidine kinase n=1 Tax=Thiolapillus brandeum TaxID=1076588 RepID=A0A7U6GI07_9GAMM|nr:sensor histidine kinase [Thiolapillus brandeum]BAO43995.1 two-component system sensor histidine kinase CbrA [Thiolapillus brandeum]